MRKQSAAWIEVAAKVAGGWILTVDGEHFRDFFISTTALALPSYHNGDSFAIIDFIHWLCMNTGLIFVSQFTILKENLGVHAMDAETKSLESGEWMPEGVGPAKIWRKDCYLPD